MPHGRGLRLAMQQQKPWRGTRTRAAEEYIHAVACDHLLCEPFEHDHLTICLR
jgi:hypothetical protein